MKKPFYKKAWFWVLLILIIGGGAGGAGVKNRKTKIDNSGAETAGNNTETKNTGSTEKEAEQKTEAPAESKVKVGGSFEVDGLKCTVDNADTDYRVQDDTYELYKPDEGMKFVATSFTFENTGDKNQYVSIYDFDCFADNAACDQKYITKAEDFINTNLSAGRTVSFTTFYQVPKDAKSIELEYKVNMFTDERVLIEIQ